MATTTIAKPNAGPAAWRRFLPTGQEVILVALICVVLGTAQNLSPGFLDPRSQTELSTHVWELALIAVPMTLIILTAGIDLSVGSMMALSGVVLGLVFKSGHSVWLAAIAALVVGSFAGYMNGVFITRVKVHPLIVTLATLAAYRGIAEGISRDNPVSGFPHAFTFIGQGSISGIPIPAIVFAVIFVGAALVLALTPLGIWLSASGYNEVAARYSRIPVDKIKLWLYTLSGTVSALAAVLFVARRNTAKADLGLGMELAVVTAVVLGGASIFGGRGRRVGTLLGVILIHETREFVTWQWNREELNFIVIGTLLLLAVLAEALFSRKSRQA
jgi:rhamnose transport system permease protein